MRRFKAALELAASRLRPVFGDDAAWMRIDALIDRLPLCRQLGFELNLMCGAVDVSVGVPRRLVQEGWPAAYMRRNPGSSALERRLMRFLRAEGARDPEREKIHDDFWLEFDTSQPSRPDASIFCSLPDAPFWRESGGAALHHYRRCGPSSASTDTLVPAVCSKAWCPSMRDFPSGPGCITSG